MGWACCSSIFQMRKLRPRAARQLCKNWVGQARAGPAGWGPAWNFLLLLTLEWCLRPGGARLGSLSGTSTPATPGIFIPV